jgi:sigma-E factor negative regulatory protein RseC
MGLMFGAALVQCWFNNDIVTILGAMLGGAAAFWLARRYTSRLDKHVDYQPILLQIAPPPSFYSVQQSSKLHTTKEANSLN